MQIESVHDVTNKHKEVFQMPTETIKVEMNESLFKDDIEETTFDDNDWSFHSDRDEHSLNSSHSSFAGRILIVCFSQCIIHESIELHSVTIVIISLRFNC